MSPMWVSVKCARAYVGQHIKHARVEKYKDTCFYELISPTLHVLHGLQTTLHACQCRLKGENDKAESG